MSTLRAYQEPDPFESHRTEKGPLFHQCPVCNTDHEVTPVRAQFAYGRQLSCSPDCEAERRRRSRAAYRRALTLVRTDAPAISRPLGTSARLVDEKSLQLKLMISESAPAGAFLKAPGDTEANCTVTAEDREFSGSARQHSRHAATAGEHKAVVTAIVESADVLQVRSAIFQTGGDSVDILKTAPVPHSSKVRVFICMKLGALDSIMTAIMRSVSACEFGRVVRMWRQPVGTAAAHKVDNPGFDFMLAMAVIVVPLALAGLLVEFQSRQKSSPAKERWHARVPAAKTDSD